MELRNFIISTIMFGMVITALAFVASELGDRYGVGIDEGWNDTYSKLDDIYDSAKTARGQVEPGEGSDTSAVAGSRLTSMIKGAWAILTMPFKILDLLFSSDGIIYGFAEDYSVPLWIIKAFLSAVLIFIVFAVASAILRHKI